MLRLRLPLLGIALVVAVVALVGCSSTAVCTTPLPTDLPGNPEECTKYCRVWVPPVYRDVPVIVQKRCATTKQVQERVLEPRYHEVCERQACTYSVRTAGKACEKAVVQVRPGGYKWKRDTDDCWRYCYEEPCYQWCNKVVQEDGIEYCMEVPPEYRVEVTHEEVMRPRTVYVPAEWDTKWVKELYTPGHYEWQPTKECNTCDCSDPCPTLPYRKSPCPEGSAVTNNCPRSN